MDGGIKFDVSANTAKFDADMGRVANSARTAGDSIKQAFSGLGGILAGGAALAGLKTLMNDFDKVAKVATRFGTSAESIQRVSVAADLAGTSIEVVANSMQKASIAASKASIEGGNFAELFERAGISAEEFNRAQLDEKLLMVSRAFEAARGNADKTNAIIEILGSRAAGQLIPLISNSEALQTEMSNVAVASDEVVRKIEEANDRMTRFGNTIKVAFAGGIEAATNFSERIGSIAGGGEGRTIAEMEAEEMRQNAMARLRNRGELLEDDTQRYTRGVSNPTPRDFREGTAWEEVVPGPNAEENVRRVNAELAVMQAELEAAKKPTAQITDELDEQVSKTEIRKQQQEELKGLALAIKEAQAAGNEALASDLKEYESLVKAAINYEGNLEMAARDVNAEHKERLRLQEASLQKTIAQAEKEIEMAETMAFGSDEAKKKAEWMKVYNDVLEKTGRYDLAQRAANAETFDAPSTDSSGRGSYSTPDRPTTALERLRAAAGEFNEAAMAEESRIMARRSAGEQRAAELEAQGRHGSAANIRAREERRAQEAAARFEDRQAARERQKELQAMSPLERAKAESADRKLAREQERMAREQSKTEKERAAADEARSGGAAAKKEASSKTLADLWEQLKELNTKLPQNALT